MRWPALVAELPRLARRRAHMLGEFEHVLAERRSPLRRFRGQMDELQLGKEQNVAVAARRLDGLVVEPDRVFSYHYTVGRPMSSRGFRRGLELHDGKPGAGIGGGCCQVSNLIYLLALEGGMQIVERHRHGLDLFPDHRRSVPFGCGATVFYNYRDLRFENPLAAPVMLSLTVEHGQLRGALRTTEPVAWRAEIYEVGHRFFRDGGTWFRENRIRRRFRLPDGAVLHDEEVAHNIARVCYEPSTSLEQEEAA
jgi:vancomycin resistance protein VanW